jgi:hypothetical protein
MMHYFSTLKLDIVVPAALHADDDGAASTHVDIKTLDVKMYRSTTAVLI